MLNSGDRVLQIYNSNPPALSHCFQTSRMLMTPSVTLLRAATVQHNQSSTKRINRKREREMRGESAGQKEILQNYGTVENGRKKKVEIKKSAEGN